MITHQSICAPGPAVTLPEWRGERHYMIPFTVSSGLPRDLLRYSQAVAQMMSTVEVDSEQECYLMVDEAELVPDTFHRRPGVHVDGYWHNTISCHGGAPSHSPGPRHGGTPRPSPGHRPAHSASGEASEALLLASNYAAARAYVGQYERDFAADWRGGDCSDIALQRLAEIQLQVGRVYKLDVMSLHESRPVREHVRRTVLRINVPGGV